MHLLSLTGTPSPTHTLVFDGDLVDRGSWSVEILLTVFCYKCAPRIRSFDQRLCDETDASVWTVQGCTRAASLSTGATTRRAT